LLRFCPACGGRLPATPVKYCPACGQSLAAFMTSEPPAAAELPATTYVAALRRYDQFIADLQAQNLDPADIRRQAADMFTKLKAQFPARPHRPAFAVKAAAEEPPAELYSIVLKNCADRERLAGRLSQVLRRSPVAVRMAVDMVPCVIVFKGKEADIKVAANVLDSENLYYTVIKGDFAAEPSLETIIPGYTALDSDLRLVCRSAPAALWLGETVRMVVAAADMGGAPAALVVTDRAVFYTVGPWGAEPADWLILPYSRLAEVVAHDDRQALEFVYRDGARPEWLRLTDISQLDQVYDHVRQAIATAQ
jgi:hypothetical protein